MTKTRLWIFTAIFIILYLLFWHYYVKPFDFDNILFAVIHIFSFIVTLFLFGFVSGLLVALIPYKIKGYKNRLGYAIPISISFMTILFAFAFYTAGSHSYSRNNVLRLEMHLSAFGVESDNAPFINAAIDFKNDSSRCDKSFYNPANKASVYSLSKEEMAKLLELLKNADLGELKNDYSVDKTDQARSQTIIYTENQTYVINDYGFAGEGVLQDLYKIVYK